jgi:sialic acid synthase SpsE
MIDAVAEIDSHKHEVIFKWQLEEVDPPGQLKLDHNLFAAAYYYAKSLGYQTTSSVFDKASLMFLLTFDIPFVKIACRPDLYWLIGKVPPEVWVVASFMDPLPIWCSRPFSAGITWLKCIPKYPATLQDYKDCMPAKFHFSDHAPGLELWEYCRGPDIWEKHFVLEREDSNPDSGVFALTPDQLKEVIG